MKALQQKLDGMRGCRVEIPAFKLPLHLSALPKNTRLLPASQAWDGVLRASAFGEVRGIVEVGAVKSFLCNV